MGCSSDRTKRYCSDEDELFDDRQSASEELFLKNAVIAIIRKLYIDSLLLAIEESVSICKEFYSCNFFIRREKRFLFKNKIGKKSPNEELITSLKSKLNDLFNKNPHLKKFDHFFPKSDNLVSSTKSLYGKSDCLGEEEEFDTLKTAIDSQRVSKKLSYSHYSQFNKNILRLIENTERIDNKTSIMIKYCKNEFFNEKKHLLEIIIDPVTIHTNKEEDDFIKEIKKFEDSSDFILSNSKFKYVSNKNKTDMMKEQFENIFLKNNNAKSKISYEIAVQCEHQFSLFKNSLVKKVNYIVTFEIKEEVSLISNLKKDLQLAVKLNMNTPIKFKFVYYYNIKEIVSIIKSSLTNNSNNKVGSSSINTNVILFLDEKMSFKMLTSIINLYDNILNNLQNDITLTKIIMYNTKSEENLEQIAPDWLVINHTKGIILQVCDLNLEEINFSEEHIFLLMDKSYEKVIFADKIKNLDEINLDNINNLILRESKNEEDQHLINYKAKKNSIKLIVKQIKNSYLKLEKEVNLLLGNVKNYFSAFRNKNIFTQPIVEFHYTKSYKEKSIDHIISKTNLSFLNSNNEGVLELLPLIFKEVNILFEFSNPPNYVVPTQPINPGRYCEKCHSNFTLPNTPYFYCSVTKNYICDKCEIEMNNPEAQKFYPYNLIYLKYTNKEVLNSISAYNHDLLKTKRQISDFAIIRNLNCQICSKKIFNRKDQFFWIILTNHNINNYQLPPLMCDTCFRILTDDTEIKLHFSDFYQNLRESFLDINNLVLRKVIYLVYK